VEKMICKTCGINNGTGNKFCTNCGEDLFDKEYNSQINCPSCDSSNEKENKFCTTCGNRLQINSQRIPHREKKNIQKPLNKGQKKKEKHKNRKPDKQNFNGLKIFWITTAIVMFAIFLPTTLTSLFENDIKDGTIPNEIKSGNPGIETKVYEIASKFVCSCGSCNEESLEVCKCERAVEERQFIRTYLEENKNTDDLILAVANRYGFLKDEFASTFNVDPSKVWNIKDKLISNTIVPENPLILKSNSQSKPWNKVCPIKGEQVDPSVSTVEYNGKNYGFCCFGCDTEFMTNPEKYSRRLNVDGTIFISG
jgi:YHS domain-containing protein